MQRTSRTAAVVLSLMLAIGCAAPVDESAAELVDAGADVKKAPSPSDSGKGGAGGSGGGGGSGGTGGDFGEDEEDGGLDAAVDDADIEDESDAAADADVACIAKDVIIDPECGLCGNEVGCIFAFCALCSFDPAMMCNELCQCAVVPPICPDEDSLDGGLDDDGGSDASDEDAGPDGSIDDEDAGDLEDALGDGDFEDADFDDADVEDAASDEDAEADADSIDGADD